MHQYRLKRNLPHKLPFVWDKEEIIYAVKLCRRHEILNPPMGCDVCFRGDYLIIRTGAGMSKFSKMDFVYDSIILFDRKFFENTFEKIERKPTLWARLTALLTS